MNTVDPAGIVNAPTLSVPIDITTLLDSSTGSRWESSLLATEPIDVSEIGRERY